MKKGLKKVLVLVMAGVMLLGNSMATFAADETEVAAVETERELTIKFMGGPADAKVAVKIPVGEYVMQAEELAKHVPAGYELCDDKQAVTIAENTKMVYVAIRKAETPETERELTIKFMGGPAGAKATAKIPVGEYVMQTEELAKHVPAGYELCDDKQAVTIAENVKIVYVAIRKAETPETERELTIKFAGGPEGATATAKIPVGKYVMQAEELAKYVPAGYELCDDKQAVTIAENVKIVYVAIRKAETPETERELTIKFAGGPEGATATVKIPVGKYVMQAEELAKYVPAGYELCDNEQAVTIAENVKIVYVAIKKVESTIPSNRNVDVKFMTDGTTVVGTRIITVAEGEVVELDGAALAVLAPEGYELVDNTQSVQVTYETAEVRVLVKAVKVPVPANKNVPIKFMTDGTTVVGTRVVTVAEGETAELNAAALAVLAPEGYELVDNTQSVRVTYETAEVRVFVKAVEVPAPANKNVPIKFMTDGKTVVGTRAITVAEGEVVELNAAALAVLAPEGYELVDNTQSVQVTYETAEVRVLVKAVKVPAPANKNVPIKFMTDGTTVVGTGHVTIAEGETTELNAAALAVLAPKGYELVNKEQSVVVTFDTTEIRVLVKAIEVALPVVVEVPVKFMTDGTTVVGTVNVLVEAGTSQVFDAFKLGAMAPKGYELVNKEQSVTVTSDTTEVRVLVKAVEVEEEGTELVPLKPATPVKPQGNPEDPKQEETEKEEPKKEEPKKEESKMESSKTEKPKAVKTGDATNTLLPVISLGLSLAVVVILLRKRAK